MTPQHTHNAHTHTRARRSPTRTVPGTFNECVGPLSSRRGVCEGCLAPPPHLVCGGKVTLPYPTLGLPAPCVQAPRQGHPSVRPPEPAGGADVPMPRPKCPDPPRVAEVAIHRSESAPAAASSTAAPPPSPPSYGSPLSASTSTSTLAPASASPYCSCKCAGAAALATPAPRGCGGSAARRRGWTLAQTRPWPSSCPR